MQDHFVHGVLEHSDTPVWAQKLKIDGYCIIDGVFSDQEISELSQAIDAIYSRQCDEVGGEKHLEKISEKGIVRSPFSLSQCVLQKVLLNENLLKFVSTALDGKAILYSQVGVISTPSDKLYQRRWHREIQYQHFTSSKPLMVQTLVPLCDFDEQNGGTEFMPGSHLFEQCPSAEMFEAFKVVPSLKAGQVVVMNSMLYHRSGVNLSQHKRRLITSAYARPFFACQFNHLENLAEEIAQEVSRNEKLQELLGAKWNYNLDYKTWRKNRINAVEV